MNRASGCWACSQHDGYGTLYVKNPLVLPAAFVSRSSAFLFSTVTVVDPPEVPLRQAPYNPPQDVASNSGSLVQVAEQGHPLVQRCPSPNPMREHRNNRTHEEVVVGGGATPHG